jgi:hypothetical protein
MKPQMEAAFETVLEDRLLADGYEKTGGARDIVIFPATIGGIPGPDPRAGIVQAAIRIAPITLRRAALSRWRRPLPAGLLFQAQLLQGFGLEDVHDELP